MREEREEESRSQEQEGQEDRREVTRRLLESRDEYSGDGDDQC